MCVTQNLYGVSLTNMEHIPMNVAEIMRYCPPRNQSCELRHLTRWVYRHRGSRQNLLNAAKTSEAKAVITAMWRELEAAPKLEKMASALI